MFPKESNERLKKRRHDAGKSEKVAEGEEQMERLRGDVEAPLINSGTPMTAAALPPLGHTSAGASPTSMLHQHQALGSSGTHAVGISHLVYRFTDLLLANSRSVTFVMALINSVIQILIYAYNLSIIINNYSPDLHKNNFSQYILHHVAYFNYMVFHCLFTGVASWATLHLFSFFFRTGFNLATTYIFETQAHGYLRSFVKGCKQYNVGFYLFIFIFSAVEIVLLALYVLECRLLVDMSVHLIDLDLVELLGIKQVLQRQRELGAGIDPDHWPYIKIVVVLLFVGQAACFLLAQWLVRKLSRQNMRKLFIAVNLIIFITCVAVTFQTVVIYEDVEHFRGQLPFNYIDPNPVDRLIPVVPRTQTVFPPLPGQGYPLLNEAQLEAVVRQKKNVILYAVESMRYDDATHIRSPRLMKFVEENKCISPKIHAASGHVSEMAQFGLLYGAHAYHYHSFSVGHIPSYAIKILRQNGYVTGGVVATAAWNYPNRNLYNNLDELDMMDGNYQFLEKTQEFVNRRKEDQKPFFLFLVVHKRPLPDPIPPGYWNRDPEGDTREYSNRIIRQKDEDRQKAIDMLQEAGLLDNKAIILITADHGNMEGEHGEKGHGQRESSWWNEKILSPSFICMPGDPNAEKYEMHPTLASHVDYVPTVMDYLGVTPHIDARAYSNGGSLLIKKGDPDWTKNRTVVFSARYFPEKNKINAVATSEYKFWFRVVAFDPSTQQMEIVPLKAMKWDDESLCLPIELRKEWNQYNKGTKSVMAPEDDKCQIKLFASLVEDFRRELFQFLQVDHSVYA